MRSHARRFVVVNIAIAMIHSHKAKALAACQALLAALPGQVFFPHSHDWHVASTGESEKPMLVTINID